MDEKAKEEGRNKKVVLVRGVEEKTSKVGAK